MVVGSDLRGNLLWVHGRDPPQKSRRGGGTGGIAPGPTPGGLYQSPAGGAVVLYVIPLGFWIYLLRFVPISWLQPIFSLTYVLTPLLALAFLGEPVPPARWIGIGVIIVGVFLVARS